TAIFYNPSDSRDYVQITIANIFPGGDTPFITTGDLNYQQTSYVSSGGSDSSNGASEGTAWRTLNKAMTTVIDGEDVFVGSGVNTGNHAVLVSSSGLLGSPIIVYGNGVDSVINSTNYVGGMWGDVVLTNYYSNYMEYRNFTLDINYSGGCRGIVVRANSIIDNITSIVPVCAGTTSSNIEFTGVSDNSRISNNLIVNPNDGFSITTVEGSNIMIYNNVITGGGIWTSSFNAGGYFYNNTVLGGTIYLDSVNFNYFSGSIGNYWYSYDGIDENGDKVGDTPYLYQDDYPKMDRESGYVSYPNGTVVPNATVEQVGATYRNVTTDVNGRYNLSTIGRPVVSLKASKGTSNLTSSFNYDNQSANFTINGSYPVPEITSWGNTNTGDANVSMNYSASMTVNFNVTTDQNLDNFKWYINDVYYSGDYLGHNYSDLNYYFVVPGNYEVKVTGNNTNGSIEDFVWNLNFVGSIYDPSGYIFDNSGNSVNNALITLSNLTWSDPCYGTHCKSDAFGYWNTDIYVNGTYDYVIYRKGYTTLTGSQIYTIGGTDYNYTLTPSEGVIHGFVSEYSNQQNTVVIPGNLKGLKSDMANIQGQDYRIAVGATLNLPSSWNPDGINYVLKLNDIDNNGQQAMLDILYDGNVVYSGYDNPVVLRGTIRYLSSSNNDINNYLNVYVKTIFRDTQGEIEFVEVSVFYETRDICTTSCIYGNLIQYIATLFINYDRDFGYIPAFYDFSNWVYQGTRSENYVVWNGADGQNFVSEELFDVSVKDVDTVFLKYIIPEDTENQYGGKIGYGYTDNVDVSGTDWTVSPQFKDITINAAGIYKQNDFMFSDIDQNGDGKIKVWLYFYGNAKRLAFDHELVAYCNNCNSKPVVGASVMYDQTHIVLTGEDGFYSMAVPFGSDKIYYSKTGYENKNITHTFNSTAYDFEQDIMINRTNVTINQSEYALNVLPDPSNVGEKIRAYYTTLCDSPTYSAYHIAVYADVDYENELDRFNLQDGVMPCALDSIPLPMYPMGSYTATIEGNDFLGATLGLWWEKILAANFTVRDTKPSVNWQSSKYYMNDTMKLNVWVMTGSENVSVFYPNNGTLLPDYPKVQSQTITPVVYSFDTHSGYPPGIYSASITGGDGKLKTTVLSAESNDNFTLSVPSSVEWGKSFVVGYTSPKSSQLYILDPSGMAVYGSVTVKDSGKKQYNTSSLSAKSQVLTVVLESGLIKRTANISVSYQDVPGGYSSGETEGDFMYNYKTFIFSNYGNSPGTLFFIGIIHVIIFTIILAALTKMPIMGMFGALLGLGFSVSIDFISEFWGVMILILAGLVFMGLMKKG
ncbi:MAG: hypothetical protein MPEBLZ_04491, partial [Candidatus Methanoperedens nitroreducens]